MGKRRQCVVLAALALVAPTVLMSVAHADSDAPKDTPACDSAEHPVHEDHPRQSDDKNPNCQESRQALSQADRDGGGWKCEPRTDEGDPIVVPEDLRDDDCDGDGVDDFGVDRDNCPNVPNRSQSDTDDDGQGDACDDDIDGDNVENSKDACPKDPDRSNSTGDQLAGSCELDGGRDDARDQLDSL